MQWELNLHRAEVLRQRQYAIRTSRHANVIKSAFSTPRGNPNPEDFCIPE